MNRLIAHLWIVLVGANQNFSNKGKGKNMKNYERPTIEDEIIEAEDIMVSSGGTSPLIDNDPDAEEL